LALLAAAALGANAVTCADDSAVNPGVAGKLPGKPASFAPAVLMPNAQVPSAPATLDPGRRAAALEALGLQAPEAAGDEAAPTFDALRLTAAQPWVENAAFLVMTGAQTVHPESSMQFPAAPSGFAALRMRVEQGASYLVDFAVRGEGAGAYQVKSDSLTLTVDDPHATADHVLTAVEAAGSGWVTVRLERSAGGFHLYAVELTRIR